MNMNANVCCSLCGQKLSDNEHVLCSDCTLPTYNVRCHHCTEWATFYIFGVNRYLCTTHAVIDKLIYPSRYITGADGNNITETNTFTLMKERLSPMFNYTEIARHIFHLFKDVALGTLSSQDATYLFLVETFGVSLEFAKRLSEEV